MSDMAISAHVPFSDPDRLPRERVVEVLHVRLEVVRIYIVPICVYTQKPCASLRKYETHARR